MAPDPVRFIWLVSQGKPLILDPVRTKSDVFGADRNFGQHLTSPVLLCSLLLNREIQSETGFAAE